MVTKWALPALGKSNCRTEFVSEVWQALLVPLDAWCSWVCVRADFQVSQSFGNCCLGDVWIGSLVQRGLATFFRSLCMNVWVTGDRVSSHFLLA
jgi:hypothetical protein